MNLVTIDGYSLRNFIISGSNKLTSNKELIDSLNVFPVPDGDTGTNMSLTALAAASEVSKISSPNVYDIAKAAANGALKGARGNSGVILSQIFRGFAKALEGKETANVKDLANAFLKATETAYKAVMKPKEGTILTTAKALSDKAMEICDTTEDINAFFIEVIKHGNFILNKTTDMLPQLKSAGVVDAGGKGLMCIIEGGYESKALQNVTLLTVSNSPSIEIAEPKGIENIDIKYSYCTEFFITGKNITEDAQNSLKSFLQDVGDSLVLVCDEDFIKIHVHTNNPGKVLERALKIGSLDNIKIENMKTQHTNRISFNKESEEINAEPKEFGFIAVSIGSGINTVFKNLGVDEIIEGGQTMNPSTEDILNAIEKVNAKNVFVLPNNKNIILAAQQAVSLCETKAVHVIDTLNVPQGIVCLINFMETLSIEENIDNMEAAIKEISTGQITYAVRDTVINDKQIKEGDFLCMIDGKIEIVSKDLQKGAKELVKTMIEANEDCSFVSIYYGEESSQEDSEEIADFIEQEFENVEVEIVEGNQPLYYYLISVE